MLGDLQEKSSLQDSEQQEDSKPRIFDSKGSLMSEVRMKNQVAWKAASQRITKNHKIT